MVGSGDGLVKISLVGGFDPAMGSPLIASHISRIRVVDWIWSSHNSKFSPSRVGILNLLISIYSLGLGGLDVGCGFFMRNGLTLFENRCQEIVVDRFFSAGRGLH